MIAASIAARPKPELPDRMLTLQDFICYSNDIACWKADKAEALLAGCYEDTPSSSKANSRYNR